MAAQSKGLSAERFYKASRGDREAYLVERGLLDREDVEQLHRNGALDFHLVDQWIENAVGCFALPLGLAFNLVVNGREYVVPMAVEETSVVAALSAGAKWIRGHGGIQAERVGRLGTGQIQIPKAADPARIRKLIQEHHGALIEQLNQEVLPNLVARGGGAHELAVRELPRPDGHAMVVIHLFVDTCDAMGANLINQACEFLKPILEAILNEKIGLCILSNLSDRKLVRAAARIKQIDPELGNAIAEASLFAQLDPYRAATNNKGVCNGMDAVLIATGNDWRAVEAGVHAHAARSGHYGSITEWSMQGEDLQGLIEVPLSVGIVGGLTRLHPMARVGLNLLKVESAAELACVVAAVGLAQNLSALKALSTCGINRGHMKLHLANLAIAAGASPEELPRLKRRLAQHWEEHQRVTESDARAILSGLRKADLL